MNWTTRGALILGLAYMCVAVMASAWETGVWGIPTAFTLVAGGPHVELLFQLSGDGILVYELQADGPGRLLDANATICRMLGYSHDELCRLGPNDIMATRQVREGPLTPETGSVLHEDIARAKDGCQIPVEVSSRLFTHRGRRMVMAILRDISERKQAETALRQANETLEARVRERTASLAAAVRAAEDANAELIQEIDHRRLAEAAARASEERYRALFLNGMDALVVTDPTGAGRVMDANPAACRLFGYTAEEFRGLDRAGILDLDDNRAMAFVATRDATGRAVDQLTYKRKDGSTFIGEAATALFDDPEGHRRAVTFIRDITERQRAEAAVRSVALFPEQNPDPILRIAGDGTLTYGNPGARPLLEKWAIPVGARLGAPECRALLAPLQTGAPSEVMVEWRGRVYSLVSIPVTDSGHVNVYGRDITERQRGEEQLRTALATNQMLLREVHHRTKNNLQMLCDLMYLQMEGMADADRAEVLRESYTRIYAIARLHEQLYQALEGGAVQLSTYLAKLVGGFENVYPKIRVELEVGDDRIRLDVDRAIHTGLIVNELVTNACKHAFPGSAAGAVVVRVHRVDDTVELQVRDTGKGLPTDFDLDGAQSLGLRIVRILTQRLEGIVEIANHQGATFTIRFPLHAEPPVEPR